MRFPHMRLIEAALILTAATGWANGVDGEAKIDDTEGSNEAFAGEVSVVAAYRADADSPVTHTNVPKEEIKRKAFGQEPSLLLADTPSVTFSSDSGGVTGYSYFRLRGIDQTRVNMTLDGVPLNEPEDQGVYFSNYPDFLSSVDSIQIQRGVGTSTNGTASFAGSLLFETPNLTGERRVDVGVGYGSQRTKRVYAEVSTGLGADASLRFRTSQLASAGFKHHSGNDSESLFIGSQWAKGRHLLKLSGFVGHQENQLAWLGVPAEDLKRDPRTNGNTPEETDRFTQALIMLRHSIALSASTAVTSCVYYNHLDGDYNFDLDNFLGLGPGSELYNYDFRSEFIGGFANFTHTGRGFELSGGLHVNRYQRRHKGSERSAGPLYENTGFKDEAAAFIKAGVSVGEWLLFGDLQLREASFAYQGSVAMDSLAWSFLNPRIGVSRYLGDTVLVYYSAGATGREPTRNDLFGGYDDLGLDDDGNPLLLNIPPEYVVDHELGIRASGSLWSLAANLYWMDFDDEITLNGQFGPNGLPLHSNVADSFRRGIEIEGRLVVGGGVTLINNSSVSRNLIREEGVAFEPVLTPRVLVNQEVLLERDRFSVSLLGRYQGKSWVDFANSVGLPSYLAVDATIGVTRGHFRVHLRGLNLLDNRALVSGAIRADNVPVFFVHPSRGIFLTVRWIS